MSITDDVRKARVEIWDQIPPEVEDLTHHHGILQPAGIILYAEAMTREFAELLWTFMDGLKQGELQEADVRQALDVTLGHFALRLEGFYALPAAASIVLAAKSAVTSSTTDEFVEMMTELRLYLTRLNLWIDLLMPWNEINEAMRAWYSPDGK